MNWTKRPTENGYYWWRSETGGDPIICRLDGIYAFYAGSAIGYAPYFCRGDWYGPITPPDDGVCDDQ